MISLLETFYQLDGSDKNQKYQGVKNHFGGSISSHVSRKLDLTPNMRLCDIQKLILHKMRFNTGKVRLYIQKLRKL